MPEKIKEWHVSPPDEPYWKWKVATIAHSVVRKPIVRRLPLTDRIEFWAFKVTVLSREFTPIDEETND